MGTILRNCLITLLLVIVQSQEVKADSAQNQDKLLFSATETVLVEELDNARGRGGVDMLTLNNMNLKARVDGIASYNVNGANIIDNGSFAQASGITSVIQNSGNNVIIQNSTIMSVTIAP